MIKANLVKEDVEIFKFERRNHPHPRVQQRMDVLWLKSNNLPHNQIADLAKAMNKIENITGIKRSDT